MGKTLLQKAIDDAGYAVVPTKAVKTGTVDPATLGTVKVETPKVANGGAIGITPTVNTAGTSGKNIITDPILSAMKTNAEKIVSNANLDLSVPAAAPAVQKTTAGTKADTKTDAKTNTKAADTKTEQGTPKTEPQTKTVSKYGTNSQQTDYKYGDAPDVSVLPAETADYYEQANGGMAPLVVNDPLIEQSYQYLEALMSTQTQYTDALNEALAKYQNRPEFTYDPNSDMLFQNYLSGMQRSGERAMRDTMGQASALTGGYGSTYAESVAAQQYNAYVGEAWNNLTDYYQIAKDVYDSESQKLLNEYQMIRDMDATQYDRYLTAYGAIGAERDRQFNQAATVYGLNSDNYWKQMQLAESQREFNLGLNYDYDKLDWQAQQDAIQREWQSLEDQKQRAFESGQTTQKLNFEATEAQKDRDFKATEAEKDRDADQTALANKYGFSNYSDYVQAINDGTLSVAEEDLKVPTADILDGARQAYLSGGQSGLEEYANRYPAYDTATILDYGYGVDSSGNNTAIPYTDRDYEKTVNKGWFGIGKDNDIVTDGYGQTLTIAEWQQLYYESLITSGESEIVAQQKAEEFARELNKKR